MKISDGFFAKSRTTKHTNFNLLGRLSLLVGMLFFLVTTFQFSASVEAQTEKPFEVKFWNFLMGNNYKQWAPASNQDGEFYTGQSPHGALLKLYANRTAASNFKGMKIGSIIVLENYLADRSLSTISVMYRTEGFNPTANDWYWIEYKPDGSVVEAQSEIDIAAAADADADKEAMKLVSAPKLMGKASSCIACHQKADGADYAFFNDSFQPSTAGVESPTKSITLR